MYTRMYLIAFKHYFKIWYIQIVTQFTGLSPFILLQCTVRNYEGIMEIVVFL